MGGCHLSSSVCPMWLSYKVSSLRTAICRASQVPSNEQTRRLHVDRRLGTSAVGTVGTAASRCSFVVKSKAKPQISRRTLGSRSNTLRKLDIMGLGMWLGVSFFSCRHAFGAYTLSYT